MADILTPSDLVIGQVVALWRIGDGVPTAHGEIARINDSGHTVRFLEDSGRETGFRLTTPHFWLMLSRDPMTGARCYSEYGPFYVFRTPS